MKSETEHGRYRRALWCLCASVPLLALAPKASADFVSISYNGTVASVSGTDPGFFGGGNIVGDAFSAFFDFTVPCPKCLTNLPVEVSGGILQANTASPLRFADNQWAHCELSSSFSRERVLQPATQTPSNCRRRGCKYHSRLSSQCPKCERLRPEWRRAIIQLHSESAD